MTRDRTGPALSLTDHVCPADLCGYAECYGSPARAPALARPGLILIGWISVGLAVAGAILPLVPATPFALVAAWAFGRASPRLRARLDAHPRLGPVLRDWRSRRAIPRAIPRAARRAAFASLTVSWLTLAALGTSLVVLAAAGAVMAAVAGWIASRPS